MKKQISPEDVIGIKEACELLNVGRHTLAGYIRKGLLHRVKDRVNLAKSYVLRSEVMEFLKTRYYFEEEK